MAYVQTSYAETHSAGRPGQVAKANEYQADTYIVRPAAGIGYGLACRLALNGAADVPGEAQVGIATGKYLGVSVLDPTRDPTQGADGMYGQGAHASIAYEGDFYVMPDHAVSVGDDVVAGATNGALSSLGVSAAWAVSNAYAVNDTVTEHGITYRCITAHTSHSSNADHANGPPDEANADKWSDPLAGGARVLVPNARWIKAAAANGLGIVRLSGGQFS